MKLAISNIAWQQHDDPFILDLLRNYGVRGIEVAPTKLWVDWVGASYKEANEYRIKMSELGFDLPAMQAILFGKPELQLFDRETHHDFLEHIKLVAELASGFGAKVLVFGAPKNRKRGQTVYSEAMDIALDFFSKAGEICLNHDCRIGLEHNPVEYGCDFITNVLDAKELVDKVNHKGFKLHVDASGIHMCGGEIASMVKKAGEFIHFHISEPMLEPIYDGVVDHKACLDTLRAINFKHWLSIEMKQPNSNDVLEKSLSHVRDLLFE